MGRKKKFEAKEIEGLLPPREVEGAPVLKGEPSAEGRESSAEQEVVVDQYPAQDLAIGAERLVAGNRQLANLLGPRVGS